MQPNIHINAVAIAVAVVASFVLGGIWYGALFGKVWGRLMGMPADFKPTKQQMIRGYGLQVLGSILVTFVLAHSVQVWRPSVWGLTGDMEPYVYGLNGALWTWIGFFVPLLFGQVAWENKPWKLFFINAGFWLVNLLVIANILAYMR